MFIAADLVIFTMLFGSFVNDRRQHAALYDTARHTLNPNFGGVNTLILLSSSLFVVMAVDAARLMQTRRLRNNLAAAFFCGLAFCGSKSIEYTEKLRAGVTMVTNDFYMYYFALTGIHLLHVVGGTVLLGIFWKKAGNGTLVREGRMALLESGATYWHMVDLLWIMLFPLLYLMR